MSVYGAMDDGYAQTTMLRVIADLIPLFDSGDGRRVILGGDFNITTAASPDTPELPRYRAILSCIESLGLVNLAETAKCRPDPMPGCSCGADDCRHIRTFGDNPGTQLDWLYATEELARRCTRLSVDHNVMGTMGDHAPLTAEFRVPPLQGSGVVDPDSFVRELSIRTGPVCAGIVEELIAWAHWKHAELDRWDRKAVSFDRLPTRDGDPPEIWFQLDKGRPGREKNLLQSTFSVRADGRVVVQFLWMTASFDRQNAREELWADLCRIEGVTLDKKLKGRPSFPHHALSRPEIREQFQRVFYVMIDRTMQPPLLGLPGERVLGAAAVVAGLVCLLDCFARFALEGCGTPAPVAQTEVLVASGLYRFLRNPMYVSVLIIISGQALLFGQARLLAYAGVMLVAFQLNVLLYEEPRLRRRFGGSYDTYCLHVGRWWPRLTPWRGSGTPSS